MTIVKFIIFFFGCIIVAYIRGKEEVYTHRGGAELMPRWVWFTKIDKYHFWTDLEYISIIILFTYYGSIISGLIQAIVGILLYTTIDFIIYPGVLHIALYGEGNTWQKFWATSNSNNSSITDKWWAKVGGFIVMLAVSLVVFVKP